MGPPPFTMAERKFSFIDFLDRVIGDLIQDGLESRRHHWGETSAAPASWRPHLLEISKMLETWSDGLFESTSQLTRGTGQSRKSRSKQRKTQVVEPLTETERLAAEEAVRRARTSLDNALQVFCYFRSLFEVLIDSDELFSMISFSGGSPSSSQRASGTFTQGFDFIDFGYKVSNYLADGKILASRAPSQAGWLG